MVVQDRSENGGSCSDSLTAEKCKASLTVNSPQLNDKLASVNDYCLKVRKPYTITKQREKWTEEEHNKFLEALKLYGRAWRRIEEHVGTKTAVQIRSHAQKFFSKIVRESEGSNSNSIDLIEIPPPRPKRKPTHPYPRKMVNPVNIDRQQWRKSQRSCSPNLSMSEQENQSPISVLSAFNSDAFGSGDSNTPNCSLSPVSNATAPDPVDFRSSEVNTLPMGTELPSVIEENDNPASYVRVAEDQKLNLFPEVLGNPESSINKERDIRSIKLFGRIVIIT